MKVTVNQNYARNTKYYHTESDCPYVDQMKQPRKETREQAENGGLECCSWCADEIDSPSGGSFDIYNAAVNGD